VNRKAIIQNAAEKQFD